MIEAEYAYNYYGQADPPEGADFVAIAAGWRHSLAIKGCRYALAGDINDDCRVDLEDVRLMAEDWLQSGSLADIYPPEKDDIVNLWDFAMMAASWLIDCGITPEDAACVPK